MAITIAAALDIDGWMSPIELEWLGKTARNCDITVEIGCYQGRSTRAICDNTKGLVMAVDPWDGTYYDTNGQPINILVQNSYGLFIANLKDCIELGQLIIMRCYSKDLPDLGKGYSNFTFLDGDHRYQQVIDDIELARKITKKNGIIAGHDYTHSDWPGVKQAVDEIYPGAGKIASIWWVINK